MKTKSDEVSLNMKLGEAYFVNTGWLHRVINPSNNIRIVLILGIDYNNLSNKESPIYMNYVVKNNWKFDTKTIKKELYDLQRK